MAGHQDPPADGAVRARWAGALTGVADASVERLPELDPIELSSGMVLGRRRSRSGTPPRQAVTAAPRSVLDQRILEALRQPPCVVAFSGGRDSSAILAAATRVARNEGLEDPIPFTLRFAGMPRAAEDQWQEKVIRHLGLGDWRRREIADELDALGPLALGVLERHGVHWPPNIHTFELLLEAAAGGSLLTGNGGDELFHPFAGHRLVVLRRAGTRPRSYDLGYLLRAILPDALLVRWARWRSWTALAWLRPAAARQLERRFAIGAMRIPPTWADELDRYLDGRYIEVASAITAALARDAGVNLIEPFFDPAFVRAVRDDSPRQGYGSRAGAMKKYFGDLLPPAVTERSTKAVFTEVFAGPRMRSFAAEWDGAGVDPALVDVDALRREWLSEVPDLRSMVPLQAAWLASRRL